MLGTQPSAPEPPGRRSSPWARSGWLWCARVLFLLALSLLVFPVAVRGAELDDCRELLLGGKYAECIEQTAEAIAKRKWGEEWYLLKARAELAVGKSNEAVASVEAGLERYAGSVRLRLIGRKASLLAGDSEQAAARLKEIQELVERAPWRYTDTEDLVALGRVALLIGADPRDVLNGFFDRAKKKNPKDRLPYLAMGQLALQKHDYQLAADTFLEGLKHFPDDPELHFGLVEAFASSDTERATASLVKTLERNPNYVPALLFKVDQFVDSEQYDEASEWLDRVLKINPHEPEAWAYRVVIAHLKNDAEAEEEFRERALAGWKENPAVDHLIGRKLSQKYRFKEGAAYQRRVLEMDPGYMPARVQLAQDLLRLGQEEEGWRLADAAHSEDGYDITTFNLLELRDALEQFRTLENDDFIVRMEAKEAAIYGERVLDLLGRAKRTLCKKYGLELKDKITVEIFPDENDFAVRTFGMPAVSGYLGVCFGKVITANSPASQGENPSNWESVLWHEFCHVVTLELTHNKMPRWLSEGISVYEELQEDPRWGQRMTPAYREMVLGGELTPLSELSSAFLSPKSPMHLQFAYYESALAVEFLVERHGLEALKAILRDLGAGLPINTAIERHTDLLGKLDEEFAAFVTERAENLAPKVDWTKPDLAELLNDDTNVLQTWVREHPNSFYGLTAYAQQLMEEREWDRAEKTLKKLIELYPEYTGADNAYTMLARVYRQTEEAEREAGILRQWIARDADAVEAYLRLLELGRAAGDWKLVAKTAQECVAVNPLLAQPYRGWAEAAEKLERPEEAISAYRAQLVIGPEDPAEVHYRLALLLHARNDTDARRHVLSALEQAPRYRAAHSLLLEINRSRN